MKNWIYISVVMFALTACQQQDEPELLPKDEASRIYLGAAINDGLSSRAVYEATVPTTEKPLNAAVWASTTQHKFESAGKDGSDTYNGVVAIHTGAYFQSGVPQLLTTAIYNEKKKDDWVYFVALYPAEGWSGSTAAKKTFSGCEDVLFAHEVSGKYGTPYDNSPTFQFHHMLTWLKFKFKAESEAIRNTWGKLQSIQLANSNNTISIDLSNSYSAPAKPSDLITRTTYSNPGLVSLYQKGSNQVFPKAAPDYYTIPYQNYEEAAYVLCAPVNATVSDEPEYTLILQTEKRGTVTVPINLKTNDSDNFSGWTIGKYFTVNLLFKLGQNVTVEAVVVTDWTTGGTGDATLGEND